MAEGGQQAVGDAWGDEISDERKAELERRLQQWESEADHGERKGPFDNGPRRLGMRLTGADVFWLAARALAGRSESQNVATAMASLRRPQQHVAVRVVLDLSALHLRQADLRGVDLSGARLRRADLSGAYLGEAHLAGADLDGAHLSGVRLGRADLSGAHLDEADLSEAKLSEVNLAGTHLVRADLSGADLRNAHLNVETDLSLAQLSPTTLLADVLWNGAPLARVSWETLLFEGDETQARKSRDANGKKKATTRRGEYEAAARAYRLLAVALRSQGLNEHADRYAYRAQLMQRVVQRLRRQYLLYIGSLLLGTLAGYGYRPLRTLLWYLAVIGSFAFAYFQATHGLLTFGLPRSQIQPLPWYEALVLSVSSFHGRGFFQPVQSLGDPVAILAAIEAVFGLFIEVSFIATFTQRYFGK